MLLPAHRAYAFKCEIVDWRMKASPSSTSSNSGQGDQLGGQETDQSRLLPEYLFQKVCCLRDGIGDVVLTVMKIESVQGHIAIDVIAEAALRSDNETARSGGKDRPAIDDHRRAFIRWMTPSEGQRRSCRFNRRGR